MMMGRGRSRVRGVPAVVRPRRLKPAAQGDVDASRGLKPAAREVHRSETGATRRHFSGRGWACLGVDRAMAVVACATCVVLLGTGCGYSTKRPFRTDIRTIHVEMAQSRDFRRELEMRLTEALAKRIRMDTPYRLASVSKADAVLTTEIIKVDNRSFGDDFDTDLPREIGTTMVARYRLKNVRTGEILAERERTVHHAGFIPAVGETFSDSATRVVDGLAEQIVESMENDW